MGRLTNEKRLIRHIQNTYPIKWGRPVLDHNETFLIHFSITLNQILELVSTWQKESKLNFTLQLVFKRNQ